MGHKYNDFNGERYDFHGKTAEELERVIDRLSQSEKVVLIITGNGKGILKERLFELKSVYHFKILQQANNGASYVVDFS